MGEIKVGDLVKIIRHGDVPNEIQPQHLIHFAVGSTHIVRDIAEEDYSAYPGVYLLDDDGDNYLILHSEIEKVQ